MYFYATFYLIKREPNAEVVCGIFETKWNILCHVMLVSAAA